MKQIDRRKRDGTGSKKTRRKTTQKKEPEPGIKNFTYSDKADRSVVLSILDYFPGIVYLQAPDYTIRYANNHFKRQYGDPKDRHCYEVIWGRKEPCDPCPTFRVFETGIAETWESTHPDGRSYRVHDFPFADKDGSRLVLEISVEITEFKKAEKALRESEKRLNEAQRIGNMGSWEWDIRKNQTRWSEHIYRIFSVDPGQSDDTYEGFLKFVHPEDREHVKDSICKALYKNMPYDIELRIVRPDGTVRIVNDRAEVCFDEEGNPVRMVGTVHDITERKQAEQALHLSEARHRILVETIPYGIQENDTSGIITFSNSAHARILGYDEGELVGKAIWGFLDTEEEREGLRQYLKKLVKEQPPPTPFFAKNRTKNGSLVDVQVDWDYKRDDAGNLVGFISVITDLTERRMSEKALFETERKYRNLFEESKDIIFICSPDGSLHDVNSTGVELLGYTSKEELLSTDIIQSLYDGPADWERFVKAMEPQGYAKELEFGIRTKDGETKIMIVSAFVERDDKGNIAAYRGVACDITEQKELQYQLIQAQKMEAVGELAGGIAHDFNNIITVIQANANQLKKRLADDEELSECVQLILDSSISAANTVHNLNSFSRKTQYNPKPVRLNDIIINITKFLRNLIGEDIELKSVLTAENPFILAEAPQIEQVITNLATNARDAMPDGGTLIISTKYIGAEQCAKKICGSNIPGKCVLISVSDTGTGMDKRTLDKIFEPFFTTKGHEKGSGLGLAISYRIIEQHNGVIHVYSEPGVGTTFHIYLPTVDEVEATEPEAIMEPPRGAETVLLAENDPRVRRVIKEMIERYGYKVIEAENGIDAVKAYTMSRDKIDILIFDVIMPEKIGKRAYDEIKMIDPDIKAIFISGHTFDVVTIRGLTGEGIDFIAKPFDENTLILKIREVLDR